MKAVRWAGEQVVERVPVQVTKELEVKEVLLVAENLRSPGGSKPMLRKYKYQSTPEALEVDSQYAEEVHLKNVKDRSRVEREFAEAEQQQGRIAARHRKRAQYARNKQQHGTARVPAAAVALAKRKAAGTPATAAGPAKQGRAEALPSGSVTDAADAPVEKELSWEGM